MVLQELHAEFQVASQFNLLEMISPRIAPEQGVGIYAGDSTQGSAGAIAAGRRLFIVVTLLSWPRSAMAESKAAN